MAAKPEPALSERGVTPEEVVTAFKGFCIVIEDNSRGSFSDEAAHRFLAAINEECRKMLAALDRPDIIAEVLRR